MRKLLKINFGGVVNSEPVNLEQHPELQDLNKLVFANPDQIYQFQKDRYEKDFKEEDTLGSGKFTVKSFTLKPMKRKMAIKFIHVPHNRYRVVQKSDNLEIFWRYFLKKIKV